MNQMRIAGLVAALCLASFAAWAKIPPPPPMDPAAKAAADEKKKASDAKDKALQTAAEDATVKNFQANMKKMGKPVPKPQPVAAATPPATGAQAAPESNTLKAAEKAKKSS
jgi:hypothetical protein